MLVTATIDGFMQASGVTAITVALVVLLAVMLHMGGVKLQLVVDDRRFDFLWLILTAIVVVVWLWAIGALTVRFT